MAFKLNSVEVERRKEADQEGWRWILDFEDYIGVTALLEIHIDQALICKHCPLFIHLCLAHTEAAWRLSFYHRLALPGGDEQTEGRPSPL